jgi:hypothetical protein
MVVQSPVMHIPYAPWGTHTPLHFTVLVQPSIKHVGVTLPFFCLTKGSTSSSITPTTPSWQCLTTAACRAPSHSTSARAPTACDRLSTMFLVKIAVDVHANKLTVLDTLASTSPFLHVQFTFHLFSSFNRVIMFSSVHYLDSVVQFSPFSTDVSRPV